MKSSRIRFYKAKPDAARLGLSRSSDRANLEFSASAVDLGEMPCPAVLTPVTPDQVVVDILVSTLLKVQQSSSPEVAAAAERYLTTLR